MKAIVIVKSWDYGVVIPHVQNIYMPEEVANGWQYGLKYKSGVFEYFPCKTKKLAMQGFKELEKAINDFYGNSLK